MGAPVVTVCLLFSLYLSLYLSLSSFPVHTWTNTLTHCTRFIAQNVHTRSLTNRITLEPLLLSPDFSSLAHSACIYFYLCLTLDRGKDVGSGEVVSVRRVGRLAEEGETVLWICRHTHNCRYHSLIPLLLSLLVRDEWNQVISQQSQSTWFGDDFNWF